MIWSVSNVMFVNKYMCVHLNYYVKNILHLSKSLLVFEYPLPT